MGDDLPASVCVRSVEVEIIELNDFNVTVSVIADVVGTFDACTASSKDTEVDGPAPHMNHDSVKG